MTSAAAWDAETSNPLEDLKAAVARWEAEPWEYRVEPYVVHPDLHAAACRLLGRPEGSPLTNRDLEEAASIEYSRLTPDQRDRVDAELAALYAARFPW